MSETVAEDVMRCMAKRESAHAMKIIEGETMLAAASRTYDLGPSEINGWAEDAQKGMENALHANPLDVREQYERQLTRRSLHISGLTWAHAAGSVCQATHAQGLTERQSGAQLQLRPLRRPPACISRFFNALA